MSFSKLASAWSIMVFLSMFQVCAQPAQKKSKGFSKDELNTAPTKSSAPSEFRMDRTEQLIQEAEVLKGRNPTLAAERLEEAIKLSIQSGNKNQEAKSYQLLGSIQLSRGLNELSIKNSVRALSLYDQNKNAIEANEVRFQLAEAYFANSQLEEALLQFKQHNKQAETQKDQASATKSKFKIAEIENKKGKSEKAISAYSEIAELSKSKGNQEGVTEANKKIGEIYQSQNQNKRALDYYKQAQESAESEKDAEKISEINENISSVLKEDKKYEEELVVRKKTLEFSKESRKPEVENKENLAIGATYLEMNKIQAAIPYLEQSITISEKLGKKEEKRDALLALSEAYKRQNKFEKALSTYQKYMSLQDSMIKEKEKELAQTMSTNIALTQKQKKIDFLEKDMELTRQTISALTHEKIAHEERMGRQRTIIVALVIGMVLIVSASYLLYKNIQKRKIANQLLALKSLRSQMNPHFIFNALNSVNAFISKNDEKSANKYLSDFSKLMRMVMENSQYEFVPLSQEINLLKLYLGLEHFRFEDKFDFDFYVDESIDTDQIQIPPMLIQPYIENAIWHGLRYKEEKGKLMVDIRSDGQKGLLIVIEDDGIGRKRSLELKTINQLNTKSTGIENTFGRISLVNELYHQNILLEIVDKESLQLNVGTRVIIKLPIKGRLKSF